jgi:[ribosomal protein S18]-alanine N-acetyltransferase
MSLPIHIRWMIRRDVASVLAIEEQGTREPWSEETLLEALRAGDTIGMVAEDGEDRIVGHMVYTLHKKRLELVRLVVAPEFRRRGVGRQLVAKLLGKLDSHRRPKLVAHVDERDLDVCLLFRECGLIARTGPEDTLRFSYRVEWTELGTRLFQAVPRP